MKQKEQNHGKINKNTKIMVHLKITHLLLNQYQKYCTSKLWGRCQGSDRKNS